MQEPEIDSAATLLTDSSGYVYLRQRPDGKITLLPVNDGLHFKASSELLTGTLGNRSVSVMLAEIIPGEVPLPDIIRLSLQDAVNMTGDGRIDDILTAAALLKAEYFRLVRSITEVLYEDEYCIAVNKVHGLLVHRTSMSADKDFLLQRVRSQCGRKIYPVHRLDRPTSGVVLFAFSKEYAAEFFRVFREREAGKTYLALVRGWTEDSGIIDSPLKTAAGKEQDALTLYKTLARTEVPIPVGPYENARYSLVEIDLKTGRTHQIRRHFAHLRHPLIGDTKYGDGRHNQMFRAEFNSHRLLLAAVRLELTHPFTGEKLSVNAPLEAGFKAVLDKLGI
ncbi:MAG: pseudouridine synthase [Victivallaceae bacterium]|nr:pseudouridine synthase [Victivallaceae bacterium]